MEKPSLMVAALLITTPAYAFRAGVGNCHDGDTFRVEAEQGAVKVRLAKIDAPEVTSPLAPRRGTFSARWSAAETSRSRRTARAIAASSTLSGCKAWTPARRWSGHGPPGTTRATILTGEPGLGSPCNGRAAWIVGQLTPRSHLGAGGAGQGG